MDTPNINYQAILDLARVGRRRVRELELELKVELESSKKRMQGQGAGAAPLMAHRLHLLFFQLVDARVNIKPSSSIQVLTNYYEYE